MKGRLKYKLHILGKVSVSVIKKIENQKNLPKNTVWLFVDYSPHECPIDTSFDILIKESNHDWNHDYKIKLRKVYDEFGRSFKFIPKGYKTLCLFECIPSIPSYIKTLPTLKVWDITENSVYLCNHMDIDLLTPINDSIVFDAFSQLVVSTLREKHKHTFTVQEITQILPKDSADLIINNLLLSGTLTQKKDDELVLAV